MISSVTTFLGKLKEVAMCEASTWTFDHHAPEASAMIRFASEASVADAKSKRYQICKHTKASGLIPLPLPSSYPLELAPYSSDAFVVKRSAQYCCAIRKLRLTATIV